MFINTPRCCRSADGIAHGELVVRIRETHVAVKERRGLDSTRKTSVIEDADQVLLG